jgi:glycosyltransferase involved in cell wall biosynthesis
MKNILFIHQSSELYGSDKTLLLFLTHIDRKLFNPTVILPCNGPLCSELEKIDIKVVIAPVLKLYRNMFSFKNIFLFYKDYKKSIKLIDTLHKQTKFHIIYSNTLAVLLGMIYARKRKIKHIWHIHEIIVHPKLIADIFPKLLNRFADVIICNSNATKNNLIQRIPELASKIKVIHNGIEIKAATNSNQTKEDFGFSSSDIVITLIGRISRLKGHKWLINTFLNHLSHIENIKILFVGSPVKGQEYYLEEIESSISKNALVERVKILPFISDLSPIWQITDIAVIPSTEAESFGLVAAEAMLAEKPVVASNHGGLTEIVVHDITGFLIEPSNEIGLSNALFKLISDNDLRVKFGKNGKSRILDEFTVGKYVSKITEILNHI